MEPLLMDSLNYGNLPNTDKVCQSQKNPHILCTIKPLKAETLYNVLRTLLHNFIHIYLFIYL